MSSSSSFQYRNEEVQRYMDEFFQRKKINPDGYCFYSAVTEGVKFAVEEVDPAVLPQTGKQFNQSLRRYYFALTKKEQENLVPDKMARTSLTGDPTALDDCYWGGTGLHDLVERFFKVYFDIDLKIVYFYRPQGTRKWRCFWTGKRNQKQWTNTATTTHVFLLKETPVHWSVLIPKKWPINIKFVSTVGPKRTAEELNNLKVTDLRGEDNPNSLSSVIIPQPRKRPQKRKRKQRETTTVDMTKGERTHIRFGSDSDTDSDLDVKLPAPTNNLKL